MEIEKKYLVKKLPEDLSKYEKWEIEQCYLCAEPAIRIRKRNEDYILTYKNRSLDNKCKEKGLNISQEVEVPLTEEAYKHLKKKADGIAITKTRYRIPYGKFVIELDVFHEDYDGFYLAEVEFDNASEGQAFVPPDWFGRDVSGDYHYMNNYLSSGNRINEIVR